MTPAAWPDGALRSPVSGRALSRRLVAGGALLVVGDEAWPIVDDIPFLRTGRDGLARAAVAALEAGDAVEAGALLLADQDPYAPDPPPTPARCRELVRGRDSIGFRDAMRQLEYGRVGDYFAHRWTDPTFLSGLAMLEQALPDQPGGTVFELACGAGHFLAAIGQAGFDAIGGDIVFSKLWLARHFVSPAARLVCHDAASPWPLAEGATDTAFCHDAFYFLPDKPGIAGRMRALVTDGGTLAVGHAHNAAAANHSAGAALDVAGYAALFPDALLFDDAELTRAFAESRAPQPAAATALEPAAAVSLLCATPGRPLRAPHRMLGPDRGLRLNPLYRREEAGWRIAWPSPRYEDEYAALATYPAVWTGSEPHGPAACEQALRRRTHVALPPRW